MKNKFVAATLICTMTSTSLVWAEEKKPMNSVVDVDDVGKISPLKNGQSAPYSGILFSPKAAAVVATEISTAKEKTKIEIEVAVKASEAKKDLAYFDLKVQYDADKKILSAMNDERAKRISELENDLKNALAAAPSRSLWTAIGAVSGIALTLLTVFVVNKTIK